MRPERVGGEPAADDPPAVTTEELAVTTASCLVLFGINLLIFLPYLLVLLWIFGLLDFLSPSFWR